MAFGSQERSEGRQRGKDGTDAIWRMIVAVPWRKNEDDAKMDGEGLEKRSRDDGQGFHGEAGDGGRCSGAEESAHNT